ncbi:MAG: hypothetical protein ACJ8DI_22410 [Ktedonobacteraceae bacterium]
MTTQHRRLTVGQTQQRISGESARREGGFQGREQARLMGSGQEQKIACTFLPFCLR